MWVKVGVIIACNWTHRKSDTPSPIALPWQWKGWVSTRNNGKGRRQGWCPAWLVWGSGLSSASAVTCFTLCLNTWLHHSPMCCAEVSGSHCRCTLVGSFPKGATGLTPKEGRKHLSVPCTMVVESTTDRLGPWAGCVTHLGFNALPAEQWWCQRALQLGQRFGGS